MGSWLSTWKRSGGGVGGVGGAEMVTVEQVARPGRDYILFPANLIPQRERDIGLVRESNGIDDGILAGSCILAGRQSGALIGARVGPREDVQKSGFSTFCSPLSPRRIVCRVRRQPCILCRTFIHGIPWAHKDWARISKDVRDACIVHCCTVHAKARRQ